MVRFLKWAAAIVGVLILAFLAVVFVLGIFRFGGMPMMAYGFRGPFMAGRLGIFAWPLLFARLLIPLAFIVLLILGGFLIGRAASRSQVRPASAACPNCGRPVLADWNNCPYCGTNLKSSEPPVVQGENV